MNWRPKKKDWQALAVPENNLGRTQQFIDGVLGQVKQQKKGQLLVNDFS